MSVCGEMAGDPASAVLIDAMGCDVLSMNADLTCEGQMVFLRQNLLSDCQALLDEVMRPWNNPPSVQMPRCTWPCAYGPEKGPASRAADSLSPARASRNSPQRSAHWAKSAVPRK